MCEIIDKGQSINTWTEEWDRLTPESEIRMWDYYGLRPWILKFAPRNGVVLEAGCGLGRYVFYLSRLGINTIGLDFSKKTVDSLNKWKKKYKFEADIIEDDVCKLPFENNSLSGYISLGVIEHFYEGPKEPLNEAFRVLRPGGIAIISTPSVSWLLLLRKSKAKIKKIIKKIIRYKSVKEEFFQYEYRPGKLKKLVTKSGLYVSAYGGADLLYTFCELGNFKGDNLKRGSFAYWFANKFENTVLNTFGAQSVTISIKTGKLMHCFFCGDLKAEMESLNRFSIPVCQDCTSDNLSNYYLKKKKAGFNNDYIIDPPLQRPSEKSCYFCKEKYNSDPLFENYGFDLDTCDSCLKDKNINLLLSNEHVQPVWRKRSIKK